MQLLDLSSNGTYVNAKVVGKSKLHTLVSGDELSLLNPNPSSHPAGGGGKATHYHYLYQDLRPPPPPKLTPRPPQLLQVKRISEECTRCCCPRALSNLAGSPRLTPHACCHPQNTSFYHGDRPALKDDYEKVKELGSGAFAVVNKVRHKVTGKHYAMKVMQKKKLLGARTRGVPAEQLTRQTLSEARILKSLEHPNVISFYDVLETETELCLLVELVEGGELLEHLIVHGEFCEADARCLMRQLLEAVGYLHSRNIVHRDLKPENILLQRLAEGETVPVCKIADFGLAKLVGNDMRASTFCGTPQYFAPEVLGCRETKRGYDSACDMWSLGVILYILLSGSPPFDETRACTEEETAASIPAPSIFDQIRVGIRSSVHFASKPWPSISPAAKHLVRQLLDVDPQRRLDVENALQHPWMRGQTEIEEESCVPMHRPSTPLEDISEYSDEEDSAMRRPASVPEHTKRQRTAPAVVAPLPLQPHAMNNRSTLPSPLSYPHFNQPLPKRVPGAPLASGKPGRTAQGGGSRIARLNIQ